MRYLGDYLADQPVYFLWNTNDAAGGSITRTVDGTISVYKDNSDGSSFDQTQVTTGITNDEDMDGLTGVHSCCITTTDAWYETGHDYSVVLSGSTIDGQTVNAVLAQFSIENRNMRGTDSAATAAALATAQADLDIITGADGVVLSEDAITDDKIAPSAQAYLQSGLATTAALAIVDGVVDAILEDTGTTIPATLATISKGAKSLVNKAIQNKSTGAIVFYDDDGVTPILTQTPTDSSTEITRTPS